ncbi:MAG: alkaline phosphatase D family protein, partial [Propionibacteriales bacterium]|nr:alkaline phosphatase D family protein [Propionibacteriales bacterium]
TPELAQSVHADVNGLRPRRDYHYRFRHAGVISEVGRFRTTPHPGERGDRMRIAFASCQAWADGYYGALGHLANEDADLHVHLGDYVYEGGIPGDGGFRKTTVPAVLAPAPGNDITRWRQQYAWYKTDPDLQAAHRAGAWMVTWDDHEVLNDYANTTSQYRGFSDISVRRRAAYQAWYEHQPVRLRASRGFASPVIYRRLRWGRLVQFDLIDGRQYRDVPPCGWGEANACAAASNPDVSLLGTEQENWLTRGYRDSTVRWNLLGSNVMLSRLDHDGAAGDLLWNDAWDGFPAARLRLMESWRRSKLRNPVTFTGDWHSTFVNEVHSDFDRPDSPVIGAEFVGTSISTNGDKAVYGPYYGPMIKHNPHITFFDGDRRGYQVATMDDDALRVDLRMVDTVAVRNPKAYTHASFEVTDGVPGVRQL